MSNNIRREVAPDWRIVTEWLNIEAYYGGYVLVKWDIAMVVSLIFSVIKGTADVRFAVDMCNLKTLAFTTLSIRWLVIRKEDLT
ncbi:15660_t:CDS:2 [Funneliformis mosseae]|uniref:15660_t:CDS:1 n=1 Tax=Funneliformis mosseae TaxID=27381 RepID=A0A9N8W1Q6_FUNMO|nr:15660_t:CDS:2 [Funneliformis mosseae]